MTADTHRNGIRETGHAATRATRYVELSPGTALGRFVIRQEIGRGGHGVVYRAGDSWLRRDVALKTIARQGAAEWSSALTEAQMLSQVHDRHVVTLFDVLHEDDADILVMELLAGDPLQRGGRVEAMPPARVAALGAQLADGLHALHAAGIIHGDIKPGNLGVTAAGVLKILDLGVAHFAADDELAAKYFERRVVAGTVPYMSPETLQGATGDVRSDIWSAGAVLYELATGRRVMDALTSRSQERLVLRGAFPHVFPMPSHLPPALAEVIAQALAPFPEQRVQTARELSDRLTAVAKPAKGRFQRLAFLTGRVSEAVPRIELA